VAALLGILVMRYFEKQGLLSSDKNEFVHVYSYGTPSCVDAKLADDPRTLGLVTSVVLHDDVVPRLTPTSVRGLLKHLLYIRETWVKTHLSDDLNAITERAYHVWPKKVRGSFTLLQKKGMDSAKRLKKKCKKRVIQQQQTNDLSTSSTQTSGYNMSSFYRKNSDKSSTTTSDIENTTSETGNALSSDMGMDVEGELFFDPCYDPLNESDDESSVRNHSHNATSTIEECDNSWVPFDELQTDSNKNDPIPSSANVKGDTVLYDTEKLEELPLPRMFIPGKIVHIYTHRGGYKAAFVPRKFRSLRRISMAGNMLSDHMTKSYYEGLLEVKAIRAAKRGGVDLPQWVGFADDCTCACCASLFTWASTSDTEAQAARDKHNCRACGGLVCDPCSQKRVPIPAIGIYAPVRVCDRCYNGWGTLYGSFDKNGAISKSDGALTDHQVKNVEKKSFENNSRRSAVVDELASRTPSIAA